MKPFDQFVQEQLLGEGVNDPAIFKAIFLAGGPGSGKSFIVGKTGLTSLGYKVVNSDTAFENAMKKAKLEMSPENIFSDEGQTIRSKAKRLTAKMQERYIKGRLGLVIDGTGKDVAKIRKQAETLKELGYETALIFVNTDERTSLNRNRLRDRSLPDKEVSKYWADVQNNIGHFQQLFQRNFIVVDNSDDQDYKAETLRAYKQAVKFTNAPVRNSIARKWMKGQKNAG